MGASELYARVDVKAEVFFAGWKDARHGAAAAAILDDANALEDPSARLREARIAMLRERDIIIKKRFWR